ncbi:MAG TPA: hypothetical protein ENI23_00655 [bacterium]|nr:hypothetical protein [bacterium]
MPFLNDINVLRNISWGRSYLWDMKFEGPTNRPQDAPPSPFNEFFPATEYSEPRAILDHYEFAAFMSTYSVPKSTKQFELSITFPDDQANTLSNWLTDWINIIILGNGLFVATLETAYRQLIVHKLNNQREAISRETHLVIPKGEHVYQGKSESGLHLYQQSFIKVG